MATWAYECRPCDEDDTVWYVAREAIGEMPHEVRVLRVRVGSQWRCAVLDRDRLVSVEGLLLRDVVASDATDCPECAERLKTRAPETAAAPIPSTSDDRAAGRDSAQRVQAAAVSLQGTRFVVVLVSRELATSPGEADLLIADLQPHFGGVPVVLMGQYEDGTSVWYGDRKLIALLEDVPLDRLPWKDYPIDIHG